MSGLWGHAQDPIDPTQSNPMSAFRRTMKTTACGCCTLCDTRLRRADLAEHLAIAHGSRNHVGDDISRKVGNYFREDLPPAEPKNVTITPEEHAIVRRLNEVQEKAYKVERSVELDDGAFVYGFFVGAGLPPKRAHEFTLLVIYNDWAKDPTFAARRVR
jgi:hypothetical protein